MKFAIHTTFCAAALLLDAGATEKPPPVDQKPATPAQKTVLDTQLKALQKAKDVQKTVNQQDDSTRKAVDDQGG
jgi:hypothetical protein